MEKMFSGCTSLKKLNISNFKTNKLNNLKYMFEGCSSLTSIDLSFLEKSNGTAFSSGMFKNCISLKQIKFPQLNSFFLFETDEMFSGCSSLETIDLSNINTLSVKNMTNMFYDCSSLISLDISKFNTRSVKNYNDIFKGIRNSSDFNITYNISKTAEISHQILDTWSRTFI